MAGRIRVVVVGIGRIGVGQAIGQPSWRLEIDVEMVGPVRGGLLADLMPDAVNKPFYMVDQRVCAAAAVGSLSNVVGEVGCVLIG